MINHGNFHRVATVLLVIIFCQVFPVIGQTTQDDLLILNIAKKFVDANSDPKLKYKLIIYKKNEKAALVRVFPLTPNEFAMVFLVKEKGSWRVKSFCDEVPVLEDPDVIKYFPEIKKRNY